MTADSVKIKSTQSDTKVFFRHLARAFGGAILFSFPILMTMEMWSLGFYMNGSRLALFTLFTIPMLAGLAYYDAFEPTSRFLDDIVDTFVAYAVGFTTAAVFLLLFGVIKPEMSADEIIGKVSIQAIIASFGAMLAQSILAESGYEREASEKKQREASYFGELFLMAVGAVFLSMSVAPTEEMTLISFQMTDWHTLALIAVTLFLMHAFVYAVEFRGREKTNVRGRSFWRGFLRFTVVGYAIALVISFYVLWTFGSIDDMWFAEKIKAAVVLGFPAAVGASASRLIL